MTLEVYFHLHLQYIKNISAIHIQMFNTPVIVNKNYICTYNK